MKLPQVLKPILGRLVRWIKREAAEEAAEELGRRLGDRSAEGPPRDAREPNSRV